MITTEEKALAQWAMEQALKGGCDGCRVSLSQGQESSIELRNEQIDKWTQSNERQMVIALYTNDRYGSVSTNRLERDELERFIKEAITSTQLLEPDPDRQLPDPALCYHGGGVDLKQYDEEFPYIGMDEKLACAKAIIEEMCDQVPNIISMESSYSDLEAYNYLINSQGFESELRGTNYGLSAVVSLMDSDEARPEAFWYDSAIRWDALNKQGIGQVALKRALAKMGQRKIAAGNYVAIFESDTMTQLVRPLIRAIYGQALHNGSSFLLNKLGEVITSEKLTLTDRPHIVGGMGSRYYNNEGIATQERTIIDAGKLNTYLIDPYYGRKLKMAPTINNVSQLQCQLGSKSSSELIAQVPSGVYITGFNGGNCNGTTGDFSYGVEGMLIDNGILTQPFSEMIVTGNMFSFWQALVEVGNDPRTCTAMQLPSMLFEGVALS